MVSIRYCDVPLYLQRSGFFLSLSADDDETTVTVPADCLKCDDTITDLDDLAQLLRTVVFWSVDELPETVLDFCAAHDPALWQHVTAVFPQDCMIHHDLTTYCDDTHSIITAMSTHRTEIVRHWMKSYSPTSYLGCNATREVASTGNFEILTELHQRGYPWDQHAIKAAIEGGHLSCLQYMHTNGCKIDASACGIAAESGQLACLKYLHEQGCFWRVDRICLLAAKGGHLDCMVYAHQHGCPVMHASILQSSNLDCVRYALANGCPADYFAAYLSIKSAQPLAHLQLLREFGVPWHVAVSQIAFEYRNYEAFRYALLNGCPYEQNVLQQAVAMSRLDFVQFLVYEMHFAVSEGVMEEARKRGNVECISMLLRFYGS